MPSSSLRPTGFMQLANMMLGFHLEELAGDPWGTNGAGQTVSEGETQLPWQDRGRTHGLEVTVNDFLYIKHLQTLQNREGEAANYGQTEALETVGLHQLIQVDAGKERGRDGYRREQYGANFELVNNPTPPGFPGAGGKAQTRRRGFHVL